MFLSVNSLTVFLSEARPSRLAKLIAIIEYLGGKASTSEIISAGVEAGVPRISQWGVGTVLGKARGRVTNLPNGWSVLPRGVAYAKESGWGGHVFIDNTLDQKLVADRPSEIITKVFVGHGHSLLWRELKDFLEKRLHLQVEEFNTVSVVGLSNKERLLHLLDKCQIGLLVMTAEDEQKDGAWNPRLNVVHEAGLFQGRHGYRRAVVILEEGCEGFSNNAGVGEIRFQRSRLERASSRFDYILKRKA